MACGTRDTVIIDWLFIYCVNTTFKHLKPVQYNIINSFGIQSGKKPSNGDYAQLCTIHIFTVHIRSAVQVCIKQGHNRAYIPNHLTQNIAYK